ncbi:hypothetical protein SapgrDRAFT_0126 [Saprospira grandis DSM 2844]|uniref:Signal peptidase I n=1 Tax=Saprospira grandis DSM 2844 TaxID=694433 RepID=J1HZR8_9BACT|nr:DUF5684 domain-containing protein [Saprospira grandis]EJF51885.1 hypothetical protein SapgrDRAFT_0126 [Saprospira grandis DSM 2844]
MASIIVLLIVYLLVVFGIIAGSWKIFEKAGKPGWAAIVPIYNIIVALEIAEKPIWWIILPIIPVFVVPIEIAKRFGKGTGFAMGMIFLPFVFLPLLGFGEAHYQGEVDELDHFGQ